MGYGGPDDRGAIWINFYKARKAAHHTRDEDLTDLQELQEGHHLNTELQFIIWINSVKGSSIAFEDGVKTVYQRTASPTTALQASLRNYQWQVPMTQSQRTPHKAPRRPGEKYTAGEHHRVENPSLPSHC